MNDSAFFEFFFLIVVIWLPWVVAAARRPSLLAVSRVYSSDAACRLLTATASLVAEHGL